MPNDSFHRRNATVSPDGQWLAYVSDESGNDEVYVQPFPGSSAHVQVSNTGGIQPRWSRDGRQLYYISGSNMISSVDVSYSGGTIHPEAWHQFFKVNPLYPDGNPFDVSPDGKLFVVDTVNSEQRSLTRLPET